MSSVVGRKWERNKGKGNLNTAAKLFNTITGYGDSIWTSLGVHMVAVFQPAQECKVKGERFIGDWHDLGGQCSWSEVGGGTGAALKGLVDHTKDLHHLL